jgi:arsenical pump membrane protein
VIDAQLFSLDHLLIWGIAALAMAGVLVRPFHWPEAVWALAGAGLLTIFGLLPLSQVMVAVAKGLDVYCFLIGMMLLASLAQREGLFAYVAAIAVKHANGSATRLFALVYLVGILVTVFLSNDATAVVLTPAVYASARAAGAKPLPYFFICAFIANAASFVLPISNPANLVVFRGDMPTLMAWLVQFTVPSLVAIVVTFVALRWTQRSALKQKISTDVTIPALSFTARLSGVGIALTAIVLLVASLFGVDLGLPTLIAAVITACVVLATKRQGPAKTVRAISWSVIPLVAGLFVLVQGIESTGVLSAMSMALKHASDDATAWTSFAGGVGLGMVCNLVNNLPLGLLSGAVVQQAHVPHMVSSAVLLGIDLGPNLSVTGSLATILWLLELRREGEHVTSLEFLKLGCLVMPPALILSLASLIGCAALH